MNKYLIPTILAAIVTISGIFAFMPIEQVSTVHGTVATATTTGNEAAGQDRAITVSANFSHSNGGQQVTVIPRATGVTLTGSAIISSTPNDLDGGSDDFGANVAQQNHQCYLQSTGASGVANNGFRLLNTTGGATNATTIGSTNMPAAHGIVLGQSNGTGISGVCTATIVLENWDD